jgi:type II secretory pathway pseudopilin PulG
MHSAIEVPLVPMGKVLPRPGINRRRISARGSRGFTMVEAMIAMMVFVGVALGIYQMMLKSNQIAKMTRYRDDARAVLLTYADQFQRLQTTDEVPLNSGNYYTRHIFVANTIASSPTGKGLRWGDLSDQNIATATTLNDTPLSVVLGGSTVGGAGNGIRAQVTRKMTFLNKDTGALSDSRSDSAAGYMLNGEFTITYSFGGRTFTDSISSVRSVP